MLSTLLFIALVNEMWVFTGLVTSPTLPIVMFFVKKIRRVKIPHPVGIGPNVIITFLKSKLRKRYIPPGGAVNNR